jgi:hypothetical protein
MSLPRCAGAPSGAGPATTAAAEGPVAHLRVVRADDRPSLTLVERDGDPSAGVAVAIAHAGGSMPSVALAALTASRLSAAGLADVRSSVDSLGFEVSALAATPGAAQQFVTHTARALSTPVQAGDAALPAIRRALSQLTTSAPLSDAARAAAECSGELMPVAKRNLLTLDSAAGLSLLENWRTGAYSVRAASLSAVGPRALLDAAAQALTATQAWPEGADAAIDSAWPSADVAGAAPSRGSSPRLSLALRVADTTAAAAATTELARENALAERAGMVLPGASVERVWYTARPRGACLRADLGLGGLTATPPAARLAALALGLRDEMDRALEHAPRSRWSLAQVVVETPDPRDAAAVAAWLALSDRLPSGATRQAVVAYVSARDVDALGKSLPRALESQRAARTKTIEHVERVEAGQGQLWALLASPCGTRGEGADDAGLTSLALRALAARAARSEGVEIEPWVTPDGAGLLAHGAPQHATEEAAAFAERVGRALARAIAGRPSTGDTAAARASLLGRLAQGAGAGWWTTLESLAPGHPSWLQAWGTWASVSEITAASVQARQLVLLDRPLRLAVLSNASTDQAAKIQRIIERWLGPARASVQPCAERPAAMPRAGEFVVETTDDPSATPVSPAKTPAGQSAGTDAFVAIPVTPTDAGLPAEAEVVALALNGKQGWLERALVKPGLAASARAVTLGGRRAAAIVIEVRALDGKLAGAVAQLRTLLTRFSQGALSASDANAALSQWTQERKAKELDPRFRVVQLWSGPDRGAPTAATVQRFLRGLGPQSHIVVTVKSRR